MERSAANSDKSSKADSSKESASRIRPVGENNERELDPLRGLVQGAQCRGCGSSLESVAQRMVSMPAAQRREAALALQKTRGNRFVQGMAAQAKPEPNRTGMPDRLKAGIEAFSGFDMSDVRVHANSDRPAGLNALAYTQGNQIYMGSGQEQHLPHEAWHVVQQAQGRVRATGQMKRLGINDDPSLEHEADMMGARSAQFIPAPEEEPLQGKFGERVAQKASNNMGQPVNSKAEIENLSEMSMDGVKVHYNSGKPMQLNALAYAQRADIPVGPGQEGHMPHETWHVGQQAKYRRESARPEEIRQLYTDHYVSTTDDLLIMQVDIEGDSDYCAKATTNDGRCSWSTFGIGQSKDAMHLHTINSNPEFNSGLGSVLMYYAAVETEKKNIQRMDVDLPAISAMSLYLNMGARMNSPNVVSEMHRLIEEHSDHNEELRNQSYESSRREYEIARLNGEYDTPYDNLDPASKKQIMKIYRNRLTQADQDKMIATRRFYRALAASGIHFIAAELRQKAAISMDKRWKKRIEPQ